MNDLNLAIEDSHAQNATTPILEARHLRKLFPLHSINPLGQKSAVHAVEDTSLVLRPGRATALVGESGQRQNNGRASAGRFIHSNLRLHPVSRGTRPFIQQIKLARLSPPCPVDLTRPLLFAQPGTRCALSPGPSSAHLRSRPQQTTGNRANPLPAEPRQPESR